jgi:hypothetical protein
MNTFNTTLISPVWAVESTLDDDGNLFVHTGPDLSQDEGISVHIERLDTLRDNEFTDSVDSICLRVHGSQIQIDIDDDEGPDPAALARRIAAQLVLAADQLDSQK